MGANNIQSHRRHTVAILLAFTALTKPAWAQSVLPTGGHVVAGSATINAPSGNVLTINQTSNRAVANWNSFSVGAPNTVNIVQPGSSAALLNRVTGNTPSTIAGQINANGQVYLVNPNGIAITPNGTVQVGGGFVASSLAITNSNFMSGNLSFTGNGASAPVSNAGKITAGPGGSVALIGGTASNSGVISVPLGKVALGSAEQATLDLNGDGFMQVAVPTGTTTAKGQALVSNSGRVDAAGGTVEMTAATVANAIRNAVNMSGVVAANSVSGHDGAIHLSGGPGGAVNVTGTLDTSGYGPGTFGGAVKVTGNSVDLAPTAEIAATGYSGGGTIEVGGGLHGADTSLTNAQDTTVEAGATIKANATGNGNGGTVAVWSNGTTSFNGSISAKGGPQGGNGGTVETSGKGTLNIGTAAGVSAAAPKGTSGSWLLDPDSDVDITNATSSASCTAGLCSPSADSSTLAASTITASLNAGTSVTVTTSNIGGSQSGNITVDSAIALTAAKTVSLTLDAGGGGGAGAITINQQITDSGSGGALSLVLNAGGAITFNNTVSLAGALTATAGQNAAGNITQGTNGFLQIAGAASFTDDAANATIHLRDSTTVDQFTGGLAAFATASGATVTISNDGGTSGTVLGTSNVNGFFKIEATSGNITQSGVLTDTNGSSVFATDQAGDSITLNTQANQLSEPQFSTTGSGNTSLKVSGNVSLSGLSVGGNFSLEDTNGTIDQAATGLRVTGTSAFMTDANGQSITISDLANRFTGAVKFTTTGSGANATLDNSLATTIDGTTSLGGGLTVDSETQTLSLNGVNLGGSLNLSGSGTVTLNTGTYVLNGGSTATISSAVTMNGTLTLSQPTTFSGAITLGGNTVLSAGSNAIDLAAQVVGGANSLTLTTTGAETLSGITSSASTGLTLGSPSSLTLNGGTYTINTSGVSSIIFPPATVNGTLILGDTGTTELDVVTLGSTTQLLSDTVDGGSNGSLTFTTVNGAHALTINAGTGVVAPLGVVGGSTPLTSLSITSGDLLIAGNIHVTTSGGGQTYNGQVGFGTLSGLILSDASGGPITFTNAIIGSADDSSSVSASTSGTVTFGGAIGNVNFLNSVAVTAGTVALNGGSITSTTISLSGTSGGITLGTATTLTANTINLNSQVAGGSNALAVSGAIAETLSGVTTTSTLTLGTPGSLTLNAGTYTIGSSYTFPAATANGTLILGDTGTTTFGPLTLSGTTQFLSDTADGGNNGNLTFGTIDGTQALTINAGTGTATFNGNVGQNTPLSSFNATAGTLALLAPTTFKTGTLALDQTSGSFLLTADLFATDGINITAAAGAIEEAVGVVIITAGTLTTSSIGGTTLVGPSNAVNGFNATNTTSGNIALTNTALSLDVTGVSQSGGGNVTINNTGNINTLGAVTTAANGSISLTASSAALTIGATVTAGGSGTVTLDATGGRVSVDGAVSSTSGAINITASGAISQNASGDISTSGTLTTNSGSGTALDIGTNVGTFNGTDTSSSGIFLQNTAATLTVTGVSQSGGGNVTITNSGNLTATGAIAGGAGTIGLTASSGNLTLAGVTTSNTGAGNLSLTDSGTLTLNAGTYAIGSSYTFPAATLNGTLTLSQPTTFSGAVTLGTNTVLSAGSNAIALDAQVTGGSNSLTLTTSGAETLSGVTTTSALTLGTPGSLTLDGGTYTIGSSTYTFPNVPTATNGNLTFGQGTTFDGAITLGSNTTVDTSANGGNIVFANTIDATTAGSQGLAVTAGIGAVQTGNLVGATHALAGLSVTAGVITATAGTSITATGAVTLDQSQSGVALNLDQNLTSTGGGTVTLESSGPIIGTSSVVSTTGTLTGSAAGIVTLTGGNLIGSLGAFTVTGGSLSLTNATGLTVTGPVSASGGITLTTTGGSNLTLDGNLTAVGNAVTLDSAGTINQSGGSIDPNSLLINSAGSVSMTGANTVDTLAASITGAGSSLVFNNTSYSLTIGMVGGVPGITTNNGNVTLSVVTSGGLTISNAINAGTASVTVASAGNLSLGAAVSGGPITLATNGNFTNTAGASALSAGGSNRWLVYSTNPANDTDGGLTPNFIQYAATYPIGTSGAPTSPDTSGNGLLYSVAPVVTVNSVTKTYNGTSALPASSSAYSLSGAINSDSVSLNLTGATGSYVSANAGSGIGITLSGASVAATHASERVFGYGLALANNGDIGTITPATLTAGLTGTVGKTYNATTAAALTSANYTLSGVIGSDSVSLNDPASGTYASANAGNNIGVSVSGLTLSGTAAGNYTLASTTASANIGSITPATLTAGLTGTVSKTYNGTTTASLTSANYTLSGTIGGDSVSLNDPASGTYASANAGSNIRVSTSGLALTGSAAGNYTLASTTASANIGTITPATLTAVLTGTVSKVYDGTAAATLTYANYTLSGIIGSDNVSITNTTGIYASANAGSNIGVSVSGLALTGTAASNYALASTKVSANVGTIIPATLTAGLTGTVSKVYDGTTAATLTPANYTLSGIIGSDNVGLNNPTTGAYASANTGNNIGVSVSGLALTGSTSGNYTLASATASANIGTIAPMPLTITASNQLRFRGEANPPLTYAITSGTLVTGDTLTGTPTTPATPSSPAGSYSITQGTLAANSNYAITFIDGRLVVLPPPHIVVEVSLSKLEPSPTQPLYVNTLTTLSAEDIAMMLRNLASVSVIAPQ